MSSSSIGQFVRAARERLGLSRQQLSDLTALSTTWLYRFESGVRATPTRENLQVIAAALHLNPWERRYMMLLARELPRYDAISFVDERAMGAYVDGLMPHPAAWIFASGTSVNEEFGRLFRDVHSADSLASWHFESPAAPEIIHNWDEVGDWLISATRFWLALNPDDPLLESFIESHRVIPEFDRRWNEQVIPFDPGPRTWHITDLDSKQELDIDMRLWQTTLRHGALLVGVAIPGM